MSVTAKQMSKCYSDDKSTKSLLVLDPDDCEGGLVADDQGNLVAIVAFRHSGGLPTLHVDNLVEKRANSDRLIACWNACAGIPTASLQESGSVLDLLNVLRYVSKFIAVPDDATYENPKDEITKLLTKFQPRIPEQASIIASAIETLGAANITDDNTPMYDLKGFNDLNSETPVPKVLATPPGICSEDVARLRAHADEAKSDPDYTIVASYEVTWDDDATAAAKRVHEDSRTKAVEENLEAAYGLKKPMGEISLGDSQICELGRS